MLSALFETMRPRQWVKNLFVFVALFFDGKLFDVPSLTRTLGAFVLLCFMSSAVYIMNDLADIENDRQHPRKKNRPLPSGRLSPSVARVAFIAIALGSLAASALLSRDYGYVLTLILLIYFVKNIAYSFKLKNIVLVDVMTVAAGFILRIAAGVSIIDVERFSPWLYVFGGFIALFLALGKRRHELVLLGDGAGSSRPILQEYTIDLVDKLISMVITSALVSYTLYTFLAEGLPNNNLMMLTIPFLVFGLFRYMYLIHVKGEGGRPEEVLLRDRPVQLSILGLAAIVILSLYILT